MDYNRLWTQTRRKVPAWISSRKAQRLLLRIFLVVTLVPLFLQVLVAYIVGSDARLLPPPLLQAKNLLIITAHPDDECLFFSPSILGVLDRNRDTKGGLLVFSTGNNYGIGEERKLELRGSCEALAIDKGRCAVLDHPDIQDSPTVWWKEELIESITREYIKKWNVDAIITFDHGGVSGHINHRAVSAAVSNYAKGDSSAPPTYVVQSTSLIRKYTILGDLPLTALPFTWRILSALVSPTSIVDDGSYGDRALVANTWQRYLATRRAFAQHASQYSWDRNLYMVLSRYVWFNDLRRVQPP